MDSGLLTTEEAAAFLHLHEATLRVLRKRPAELNPLPALKSGRRWLYRREALLRWMEIEARRALQRSRVSA